MTDENKRQAAKAYLQQIKNTAERIAEVDEIIKAKREQLIMPARSYAEPVTGGQHYDTFALKMAANLDRQISRDELVIEYELLRSDIFLMVLKLEDERYSSILYQIYFKFIKPEQYSKNMGYSKYYCYHLLRDALVVFYDANKETIDKFLKTH